MSEIGDRNWIEVCACYGGLVCRLCDVNGGTMVKSLLLNPTNHEIECTVTSDSDFNNDGFVQLKIQLCGGGGEALGAVSYNEALHLSKWFKKLSDKMKPNPKKKKSNGVKRATKANI